MDDSANTERRPRALLAGTRDAGLALLSALLLLAASPPWNLWPAGLVGLVPLLVAIEQRSPGQALLLGWIAGTAANAGGMIWAIDVMQRFGGLSGPASIATLAAIAGYQGSIVALWAAGTTWLARGPRLSPFVAAPLLLILLEATLPLVFPWYLAICVWRAWPLLQVAEVGGPLAVSALVVLGNLIAFELARCAWLRARPRRAVVAALLFATAVCAAGLGRAAHVARARAAAPALRVAIVQPNAGVLSPASRTRHGQRLVDALREATEAAGGRGAELVVWPESAFPFLFDRQLEREYARGHPWALRRGYRGRLLVGTLTHPFGEAYVYNSAVLFDANGARRGLYDKRALLVFGEYVPLRARFPGWARRVRGRLPDRPEIRAGREPRVLVDRELRVLPLICYEDILAGEVQRAARQGAPNLLVTLANHAWFGQSAAPHQAAALALFRAIETRRDLVRATGTGVSSVADALGRILVAGPLRVAPRDVPPPGPPEVLVSPVRLLSTPALGPWVAPLFPWITTLALVVAAAIAWRRRR